MTTVENCSINTTPSASLAPLGQRYEYMEPKLKVVITLILEKDWFLTMMGEKLEYACWLITLGFTYE